MEAGLPVLECPKIIRCSPVEIVVDLEISTIQAHLNRHIHAGVQIEFTIYTQVLAEQLIQHLLEHRRISEGKCADYDGVVLWVRRMLT